MVLRKLRFSDVIRCSLLYSILNLLHLLFYKFQNIVFKKFLNFYIHSVNAYKIFNGILYSTSDLKNLRLGSKFFIRKQREKYILVYFLNSKGNCHSDFYLISFNNLLPNSLGTQKQLRLEIFFA